MPQITKTKTTTYNITHVGIDFLTFNEQYRKIRGGFEYKGFKCYSCNKSFKDGDKISLICTDKAGKGNKTVCHKCGIKFMKELEG
jgi:DNA-directed RNA polymerase subunit RPC12/RpoP